MIPTEPARQRYTNTLVGRVNRHRLIAVFVCVPLSLIILHLTTSDHVTSSEALQTIVFAVATYACGAASISAWPSKRKQALAGPVAPSPLQVWMYRLLSITCAFIALLAALGAFISVHNA